MLSYSTLKRLFDVIISFLLLFLLSPLFFFIGVFIKKSSKGPIFFSSLRLGQHRSVIKCWKFRTMHVDAERSLENLLQTSPKLKEEWQIFQTLKEDPRIFSFGKFLRTSSLDELPQLWNIFVGEMSLIGPRPFLLHQLDTLPQSKTSPLLSVKPGLTGLWQVSGRSLVPFQKKVELEIYYARHLSLKLDIKIFFKTFSALLNKEGAF